MSYVIEINKANEKVIKFLLEKNLVVKQTFSSIYFNENCLSECIPYLDTTLKNKFLYRSVEHGYYNSVKLLLVAGANANTEIERSVLWAATANDDIKMVELLLAFGADPCKRYEYGSRQVDAFMYVSGKTISPASQHIYNMMLKHVEDKKKKPEGMS